MKFLFDQSADFRLIPHLRQLGHDVHVISRNYPPGLPDEDVLEIASTTVGVGLANQDGQRSAQDADNAAVGKRIFGPPMFQPGLIFGGEYL
jgi:hypothetical protein